MMFSNPQTTTARNHGRTTYGVAGKGVTMHAGRLLGLLATATAALLFGGCAEPVEDINRVQPHYVKKSLLTGEWYYRQTIVDVPQDVSVGFTGIEGALEKIRWEITEERLIGYRIHEIIPGLDADSTQPGADFDGDPVAVFTIDSHFDILRGYNTATGEKTNEIVENSTDRPWFEREYMRVDWGSMVTDGPVDFGGFFSLFTTAIYWERESEDMKFSPDQLQFEEDYIQITTYYALNEGGTACLYSYYSFDCGIGEVKVRQSFAKIDSTEIEQFEPRSYMDAIPLEDEGHKVRTISLGVDTLNMDVDEIGARAIGDLCNTPAECAEGTTCVERNGARTCQTHCEGSVECGTGRACVPPRLGSPGECTPLIADFACTPEFIDRFNEMVGVPGNLTERNCYSTLQYDQFAKFGFFRTERNGWDRRAGTHDEFRRYYANIHNVWKYAYEVDDEGALIHEEGKKVPIPMADRELRPIVYYLSVNFPENLKDTAARVGSNWNTAFMTMAVAATGRDAELIGDQIAIDMQQLAVPPIWLDQKEGPRQLFQLRENTCSVVGIDAYLDRNPSMQDVMDEATRGAGILPGNIKGVCAGLRRVSRERGVERFVWQQVGDIRYSLLNWVNEDEPSGPLGYGPSSADAENGRIISGNAHIYGASLDRYARGAADVVRAMNDDLDINQLISGQHMVDWMESTTTVADYELELNPELEKTVAHRLGPSMLEDLDDPYVAMAGQHGRVSAIANLLKREAGRGRDVEGGVNEGEARLEALRADPRFRNKYLTNEALEIVRPFFAHRQDSDVTEEMEEMAIDWAMNPDAFNEFQRQRFKFYSDRNVYLAEFLDDSIIGQAIAMKGMDPEEVYAQLREEIFRSVALHEIGHTVGMTHNFEGSMDALNYQDEFWKIRATKDESDWSTERLPEYQYSTIMEYGSRFNSDTKGLGKYDLAAIKFVYGRQAEVFADDVPVPMYYDTDVGTLVHGHEVLPNFVGDSYENINKRSNRSIDELAEDKRVGILENSRLFVEQDEVSPEEWWYTREVPYHYCYDIYRGNLGCRVFDQGASHTEVVRAAIQRYWNYYFFNSFRRGRFEYSFVNSFFARQNGLGEVLSYPFRYYFFYRYSSLYLSEDLFNAALMAMNFIHQVLGTPESGRHCLDEESNMYLPAAMTDAETRESCESIDVPVGSGRYPLIKRNDEHYSQIDYVGSYYDKMTFLYHLMNTSTRFWRVSNLGDSRRFEIGFWRVFRPELMTMIRDMVFAYLGEREGSTFNAVVDGKTDILPPLLVDPRSSGGGEEEPADELAKVYSPVSYNMVWRILVLAGIFNTSAGDDEVDFIEYVAVCEVGSGSCRDIDGMHTTDFAHPETGVIYRASQTADRKSIAYEFLQRASALVENDWRPAKDRLDKNGDDAEAAAAFASADHKLSNYMELIGDLRLLRSAVDVGPRR